jgi:hypothetical protein
MPQQLVEVVDELIGDSVVLEAVVDVLEVDEETAVE